MNSLSRELTQLYEFIWKTTPRTTKEVSFIQRCRNVCAQGRLQKSPFYRLPPELRNMTNWREACVTFERHLPSYHNMLQYVIKRVFKVLFESEGNAVHKWYVDRYVMDHKVVSNIISGIRRCCRGGVERRAYLALLHASFTVEEINVIISHHKDLTEEIKASSSDVNNGSTATNSSKEGTVADDVDSAQLDGAESTEGRSVSRKFNVGENGDGDHCTVNGRSDHVNLEEGGEMSIENSEARNDDSAATIGESGCQRNEDPPARRATTTTTACSQAVGLQQAEPEDGTRTVPSRSGQMGNGDGKGTEDAAVVEIVDATDENCDEGNGALYDDLFNDASERRPTATIGTVIRSVQSDTATRRADVINEGSGGGDMEITVNGETRDERENGMSGEGSESRGQRTAEPVTTTRSDDEERVRRGSEVASASRIEGHKRGACELAGNGDGKGTAVENDEGNPKKKRIQRPKADVVSRYIHWRSRNDMVRMLGKGELNFGKKVRRNFDDNSIRETLLYILNDNNVQLLSWGTTRVKVNGEKLRFPHLVRKIGIEVMWRNYVNEKNAFSGGTKKVGRTLFCDIVSRVTKGDIKQRACVDYKLHALVYENTSTLKRIIEDQVRHADDRKELKKKLSGVVEYLKYSYVTHLDAESDDPYHNTKFGLRHGIFPEVTRISTCDDCNRVFKFLEELRAGIIDRSEQVEKILDGAAKKFEMYMGHKVRAELQEERIKEIFRWAKNGGPKQRVVVFIDFKMKVEPERLRETQLQYYGKSGMSWHGAAVFYKPNKENDGEFAERMKKFETRSAKRAKTGVELAQLEAAKTREENRLSMFFVDHISENDKKQDRVFTASIIDALCFRIRKELPEATDIAICSDNARNYNNDVLPIMLPMITSSHGLDLNVYVHPDACCGKSCVDAHFAVSFRHLKRYITETRHDVLTPEDIVDALTYDDGVKNTFVDYIKTNRQHDTFLRFETASETKLIASLRTPAEIVYKREQDGKYTLTTFTYSKCCFRKFDIDGHESFPTEPYVYANAGDKEIFSSDEEKEREAGNKKAEKEAQSAKRKAEKAAMKEAERAKREAEKAVKKKTSKTGSTSKERKKKSGPTVNEKEAAEKAAKLAAEKKAAKQKRKKEAMKERRRKKYREQLEKKRKRLSCRGGIEDESCEQDVSGNCIETEMGSRAPDESEDDEESCLSSEDGEQKYDEECPFDAINDKYGYVEETGQEEEVNDEPALHGVVNLTEETARLREGRGKQRYFEMDPIHICEATGVEIKFMSGIHYWGREAYISARTAFGDAEAEVWTNQREAENSNTDALPNVDSQNANAGTNDARNLTDDGNGVQAVERSTTVSEPISFSTASADDSNPGTQLSSSADNNNNEQTEATCAAGRCQDGNDDSTNMKRGAENSGCSNPSKRQKTSETFTCARCTRVYKLEKKFEEHVENCMEDMEQGDTLQRALKMAHSMVYMDNELSVHTRHETHPSLSKVVLDGDTDYRTVKRGWARRPKWGQALGENTIVEFRNQIKLWFEIGAADASQKLSACRMLKLLQGMNPHRYDLPTENQIRSVITTLAVEEKKKRECAMRERIVGRTHNTTAERNAVIEDVQVVSTDVASVEVQSMEDGGVRNFADRLPELTPHGTEVLPASTGECIAVPPAPSLELETPVCTDIPVPPPDSELNENQGASSGNCVTGTSERNGNMDERSGIDSNNVGIEESSIATDRNPITKATKFMYKMPDVYATVLRDLVLEDRNMDRKLGRQKMIAHFGWVTQRLPDDFPTEEQVRRRITGVKYFYKKKFLSSKSGESVQNAENAD